MIHGMSDDRAEERFDIYDEAGDWIGTATRSDVHKHGYWHHSIHCWLARADEQGRKLALFQLRHPDKDTFPLHYDITAAGHLSAGETYEEASREIEEELGVPAPFEALVPLGETRREMSGSAQGVSFVDREISRMYGLPFAGELTDLRLQADEVAGVYEAELSAMIDLFEGRRAQIEAQGVRLNGEGALVPASAQVAASQFVTRPASYYAGVFRQLLHMLEPGNSPE
ncbi:NUDIX hydrolase [Paenibacillus methanolicus]|uniref:Isopentenyldiphosphate isomerase n=1 Tax=Paenibacillus methanolicus TaxID=582686 RepID=A0A5S5BWY5_9BACL|nr:NUDIX domain-containing protein [Paenibacillus methanolicus]TYP70702.1 isopentenyldiphosphate isomerase [Paenibacillus methanolicus]